MSQPQVVHFEKNQLFSCLLGNTEKLSYNCRLYLNERSLAVEDCPGSSLAAPHPTPTQGAGGQWSEDQLVAALNFPSHHPPSPWKERVSSPDPGEALLAAPMKMGTISAAE